MEMHFREIDNERVAEIVSEDIVISTVNDALEIMADANYQGASKVLIGENNINPAFFDLKTGLAGEIIQKFVNYRMKLSIVGNFEKYESKSLRAFIIECNRGSCVSFISEIPNPTNEIE